MRVGELAERSEAEIKVGHRIWGHGRSPTCHIMPAIDPRRGDAHPVGRHVIVIQALRDMQQLAMLASSSRASRYSKVRKSGLYDPMSCAVKMWSNSTPSRWLLSAKLDRSTFDRITSLKCCLR